MAVVSESKSMLNPNAPLFIPAAFRQVEDFSPEWWDLIKTSPWFHDYWLNQHQEEEEFNGNAPSDDNCIENLLPESFDTNFEDEFLNLEAQLDVLIQSSETEDENDESALFALKKEKPRNGLEMDVKAVMENLSMLKFSKERGGPKSPVEPVKYQEKAAAQYVSPKCSPRRIHQPR